MATSINLQQLIYQEALAQGVPPEIALGVAQTESAITQWTPNGNVVTSPTGALGVFQLEPSTAEGLGVNPLDVNGNIQGGITYLKQLYAQFGNWNDALAAYNWGPGNVNSGNPIPTSVGQYVSNVLAAAGNFAAGLVGMSPAPAAIPGISPPGISTDVSVTGSALDSSVIDVSAGVVAVVVIGAIAAIAWIWGD